MHVAFMAAFVVSVVIAAFWVVTLPEKFAEIREVNEQAEAKRQAAQDAETERNNQATAAALGSLVASTTEAYHDLSSQLQALTGNKDETYTNEAVTNESDDSIIIINETN